MSNLAKAVQTNYKIFEQPPIALKSFFRISLDNLDYCNQQEQKKTLVEEHCAPYHTITIRTVVVIATGQKVDEIIPGGNKLFIHNSPNILASRTK